VQRRAPKRREASGLTGREQIAYGSRSSQTLNRMSRLVCIFMAASLSVLAGCSSCENEISQTVPSPSGREKAVVFHRGCGATVGVNTQISVIPASDRLGDKSGNVAIVDGSPTPTVQWESESSLRIGGLGSGRLYKAENQVGHVFIAYGR
jgi:hypothetical protein